MLIFVPACICNVSFTGTDGMVHAMEVSAGSLYEAAVLALAEFRKGWLVEVLPGRATRLTVTVNAPATRHELTVGKLEDWLASGGKNPKEQSEKGEGKGTVTLVWMTGDYTRFLIAIAYSPNP
jgi:hypothetical protein